MEVHRSMRVTRDTDLDTDASSTVCNLLARSEVLKRSASLSVACNVKLGEARRGVARLSCLLINEVKSYSFIL